MKYTVIGMRNLYENKLVNCFEEECDEYSYICIIYIYCIGRNKKEAKEVVARQMEKES